MARRKLSDYGTLSDFADTYVPVVKNGHNYKARPSALGNPQQILDVRDFGSNVGTGGDDGEAFNAATAYLRNLGSSATAYFIGVPGGVTLNLETPGNASAIRNIVWGIVGPGKINLKTNGQPGIDFTHSRYPAIRDLWLHGDSAAPPNVGVLLARRSDGAVADKFRFWDVAIEGEFTLASLFNYGSEDFYANDLICWNARNDAAAYCAILTGYNSHGVTSPYQTVLTSTAVSFNNPDITKGDFRRTVTGAAAFVERSAGPRFKSGYLVSYDDAAIVVNAADSFGNEDLFFDVHCETAGLTDCVRFDGVPAHNVKGLYFHDFAPQAANAIFKRGSSTSVTIKQLRGGIDEFAVAPSSHLFDDASGFTLLGGRFELPDTTHLNSTGSGIEWVFASGKRYYSGSVGFGQSDPSRVAEMAALDSNNATVSQILRLTKLTTGSPASGIGGGIELACQTGASTYVIAGSIEFAATDVTGASEDFDLVFKLMKDGAAAAEVFRVTSKGTAKLKSFTVATLPTGQAGWTAFASDGRKAGEGAGSGTGVLVFHDGTAWRAVDTGATVAA